MTTDISTEATEALNDLRSELVTALEGVAGLKVTADPQQVNPPCCLVGVPEIERIATLRGDEWMVDVTIPVTLIAPPPASSGSIGWLLSNLLPVMRRVGARDASPLFTDEYGNTTLPTYPLTVRKQLRIQEAGS